MSASLFATREKSMAPYFIKKNVRDNSLSAKEALVLFTFHDASTNKPIGGDIRYAYNGVNSTINADGKTANRLNLKPGQYVFQFYLSAEFSEIKTDTIDIRPGYQLEIQVNFHTSKYPVICDKPVIYIYPETVKEISVKLDLKGKLNFTYPEYKNEWKITACDNGKLQIGERKYDYLFWEGGIEIGTGDIDLTKGFIVSKKELVTFLENKLSQMGLNDREQQDFITYWVPLMIKKEKLFIHFLFNGEFSKYAPLTIKPEPKNIFRVFMLWSDASSNTETVNEQIIPSANKNGYNVIEWGGGMLPTNLYEL